MQRAADPTTHVDAQVNSQKREQVLQQRKVLASIVETVKFVAIQNIPLRRHRDDSRIEVENDGNFRMLLHFQVNTATLFYKYICTKQKATHCTPAKPGFS